MCGGDWQAGQDSLSLGSAQRFHFRISLSSMETTFGLSGGIFLFLFLVLRPAGFYHAKKNSLSQLTQTGKVLI